MLSLPGIDRPNRLGQYVFVNKRAVVAPQVSYAIQEAYGTMLTPRRFPVFVLDITLRPDLIDVNVHPQKKEIRFKEEQLLKELLRDEVNKHLNAAAFETIAPAELFHLQPKPMQEKRPSFDFKTLSCFDSKESITSQTEESFPLFTPTPSQQLKDLKIIGLFKHYLLIEAASCARLFDCDYLHNPKDGFIMVDLAGMSRRMYYEKALMTQESTGCLEQLLFPIKMEFTSKEAASLEGHLELLETLGMHVSLFGKNTFILQACDKSFDEEKIEHFLREFLEEDKLCGNTLQAKKEKLALKACKYLALENKTYDFETAKMILSQFLKGNHLFYTPDGKKIIGWIREGIYAKGF
jgi:DNA mismatch repair protein MutL